MTTAEENPPRLHTSNPHTHKKLTSGQTDRYGIRNRLLLLAKCPAHLGERRILKLTDPLAGYPELTTDFFQSESLATAQSESWKAPFYWYRRGDAWHEFTLAGLRPVNDAQPATHLSYFEADAFARWSGSRLPTEFEWEHASGTVPMEGNFVDDRRFHPVPAPEDTGLRQMFGDVWEWTSSQYTAYPGYKPAPGALGEYNGKFMCNQFVLRGGSCATSANHIRPTYRNFFPPEARWQFTGVRLAR